MKDEKNIIELEIKRKQKTERRLRLRSVSFIVLIIAFGIIWAAVTDRQIKQYSQRITQLKDTINNLQKRLDTVSDISNHIVSVSLTDTKELFNFGVKPTEVIIEFMELKDTHSSIFSYNANEASAGKNEYSSPSMMIFVLKKHHLIPSDVQSGGDLANALKAEPPSPDQPLRTGDILFYKSGYVMIYGQDLNIRSQHTTGFCIGMTPFGILTLDPDFAEIVKIGRPAAYY